MRKLGTIRTSYVVGATYLDVVPANYTQTYGAVTRPRRRTVVLHFRTTGTGAVSNLVASVGH